MAILRGGRRIGNYDIRVGIPRDRSLDNVNGDERLRRKPGGNPESTINRFIAEINQGEGLARPNRFMVMFHLPQRVLTEAELIASEFGGSSLGTNNDLESLTMAKTMSMMCNKVTMPNRDVNTKEHLDDLNFPEAINFTRKSLEQVKNIYHHLGIYCYKKETLQDFVSYNQSSNEIKNRLEQLRALDNNIRINVALAKSSPIGVDTEEDFVAIIKIMEYKSK